MSLFKHVKTPAVMLSALLVAACAPTIEISEDVSSGLLEGLADGTTRLIDLTHALSPESPHWPGPGYEPFAYEIFATIADDGVLSGRFTMAEHTGTHLDAPNHFSEGQIPVDRIPLGQLIVRATVIDVREQVRSNPDYQLTPEDVTEWEAEHGTIGDNTLVFMYTGWDARWDDFDSYKNADEDGGLHFPGFSPASAELLVNERNVVGLGIDTLSVDYGMSQDFRVHHISHGQAKYHIENAADLGRLPPSGAWVIVAPIKIENGTGGPARIIALVGE
jgi:kynurenine formamidase